MKDLFIFLCIGLVVAEDGFQPAARCLVAPPSGDCGGYQSMYYYNQEAQTCMPHVHRGCGSIDSLFVTFEDCLRVCKGQLSEEPLDGAPQTQEQPVVDGQDDEDDEEDDGSEALKIIQESLKVPNMDINDSELLQELINQHDTVAAMKPVDQSEAEQMQRQEQQHVEQQQQQHQLEEQPQVQQQEPQTAPADAQQTQGVTENNDDDDDDEDFPQENPISKTSMRDYMHLMSREDDELLQEMMAEMDTVDMVPADSPQALAQARADAAIKEQETPEKPQETPERPEETPEKPQGIPDTVQETNEKETPTVSEESGKAKDNEKEDDDDEDLFDEDILKLVEGMGPMAPEDSEVLQELMSDMEVQKMVPEEDAPQEAIEASRQAAVKLDEINRRLEAEKPQEKVQQESTVEQPQPEKPVEQTPPEAEVKKEENDNEDHDDDDDDEYNPLQIALIEPSMSQIMNPEDREVLDEMLNAENMEVAKMAPKQEPTQPEQAKEEYRYPDERENLIEDRPHGGSFFTIPPFCTLPGESGPCRGAINSWYFDPDTGSCKPFAYGGCGGNGNRFRTRAKCLLTCRGSFFR